MSPGFLVSAAYVAMLLSAAANPRQIPDPVALARAPVAQTAGHAVQQVKGVVDVVDVNLRWSI